jgi:hypothetical protein
VNKLEEIREREKKATNGPWRANCGGESSVWGPCPGTRGTSSMRIALVGFARFDARNADFIANARQDIPYLLSLIEEARNIWAIDYEDNDEAPSLEWLTRRDKWLDEVNGVIDASL